MSKRCSHPNLIIMETGSWNTEHARVGEDTWDHNNKPGGYNRRLDVVCPDCGMKRTFWRGQKNMPKYMLKYMEELGWI